MIHSYTHARITHLTQVVCLSYGSLAAVGVFFIQPTAGYTF